MADASASVVTARRRLRAYEVLYVAGLAVGLAGLAVVAWLVVTSDAGVVLAYPLVVVLLVAAALVVQRIAGFRAHAHIPGPRPAFLLGNMRSLLSRDHGLRDQTLLALHDEHGPMLKLHLAWGSDPFVSISHTSDALTRRDVDSNRRADREVLGDSLMGAELGPRYKANRRSLNPYFSARGVKGRAASVHHITEEMLDVWRTGGTTHGSIQADLRHWSAHSLARYLCGQEWAVDQDLSDYLDAIHKLESAISLRAFHPFFVRWTNRRNAREAAQAYRDLSDRLEAMMEARLAREAEVEEGAREDDVLGTLARAEKADGWTRAEAIDEMVSMVAGGTDSMSYVSSQALLLLAEHPDIQREAHRRVTAALESGEDDPYLTQVIHETLRLHPPVPFSAKFSPRGPLDVDGVAVPERTNLMWMKTAVGRNPGYYHQPDTFDPDRYDRPRPDGQGTESIQPAMPFGGGPRHCVGRALAEHLLTHVLTRIITEFEVQPVEGVEVTYSATVSVTPSSVPVRLVPRRIDAPTALA